MHFEKHLPGKIQQNVYDTKIKRVSLSFKSSFNCSLNQFNIFVFTRKIKKSEVSHLSAPRQENKLHDKTSVSRIRLKALNLTKEQPKVYL